MKILDNTILLIFFTVFITTNFKITYADIDNQKEQLIVPVPETFQDGLFILNHYKGSVSITGYVGNVIIVKASLRYQSPLSEREGMLEVSKNTIQLSAEIYNNIIELRTGPTEKTIDVDILIPTDFSLRVKNYDNGNIQVQNLNGEMEINNINGDITLQNISGSVILNTIDGNISVDLIKVIPNQPMAITSIEGNIDLRLPIDTKAILKLQTDNGQIFSSFKLTLAPRNTEIEKDEQGRIKRISLNEWTLGLINGGGPEYLIKSYNGNIHIRSKL